MQRKYFFILLLSTASCLGQATKSVAAPAPSPKQSSADAAKAKADAAAAANLKALLNRSAAAAKKPLGDYVPCLFDDRQETELRARTYKPDSSSEPAQGATGLTLFSALKQGAVPAGTTATDTLKQALAKVVPDVNAEIMAGKSISQVLDEVSTAANSDSSISKADQATIASIVQSIRSSLSVPPVFDRPDDVSCSVSVLDWQETSDVFGRRIANQFVAIQVNIRNLNTTNEFLIHDLQVAVDTGVPSDELTHFQSGRDKLLIRAVAQRGQSEDRRNLVLNSLSTLGAVAGSASSVVATAFSSSNASVNLGTAVAIFQGPFMAGLNNIFPDHTVEQINHISDLTFSASSSSKTVVPVQGAVPLVTFIPQDPIKQLPYAKCGAFRDKFWRKIPLSEKSYCDRFVTKSGWTPILKPGVPTNSTDGKNDNSKSTDYKNDYPKSTDYKKWQAAALEILRSHLFVVVGGVHIQELSSAPVLNSLDCPLLGDGTVDTSIRQKGMVTCPAKGSHLDRIAGAKLELSGAQNITGTISASTDGSTADVQFDPTALQPLSGSYELFLTDSAKNDSDAGRSLKFATRVPTLAAPVFAGSIDSTNPWTVTLSGQNLDQIDPSSIALILTSVANPPVQAAGSIITSPVLASANSIAVTFPSAALATAKGPVTLTAKDLTGKSVTITGSNSYTIK